MIAEPDHYPPQQPVTAHEPVRAAGSILLVLLVAGAIIGVAVALTTIGSAPGPALYSRPAGGCSQWVGLSISLLLRPGSSALPIVRSTTP